MDTAQAQHAMGTLNLASTAKRRALSAIKAALRRGEVRLEDLMTDPPDLIADVPLIDVIRWTRRDQSATARIAQIGAWAVRDGVNLMQPVGVASQRSRAWVAEYGMHRFVRSAA